MWDDIQMLKDHKQRQIDENRFVSKAFDEIRERLDVLERLTAIVSEVGLNND